MNYVNIPNITAVRKYANMNAKWSMFYNMGYVTLWRVSLLNQNAVRLEV